MSLYYLQKLLYQLNRQPELQELFKTDTDAALKGYELSDEEGAAVKAADIGLLYVLGVNGQILMHFAAFMGYEWEAYKEAMRAGIRRHGPVRAGLYAMTTEMSTPAGAQA